MRYSELLQQYIKSSRLTLDELSEALNKRSATASKQYLSKLQNGRTPPASDELNREIAEITGGDPNALVMAAYIEKAPAEIKDNLREAAKFSLVFSLLKHLIEFLDFFRHFGRPQEDILSRIEEISLDLRDKYNHVLQVEQLNDDPEKALEIIRELKRTYYPNTQVIRSGSQEIDFYQQLYLDEHGEISNFQYIPTIGYLESQTSESGRAYYGGGADLSETERHKIEESIMEARIKQALDGNKLIMNGYVMECTEDEARHLKQQLMMLRALNKDDN